MANIKFSAFTQKVAQTDVDFLVGYTGADNVRISPSTIGQGVYLPLAGGTMTGNILLEDSVKLSIGTSDDFNMFFNGTDTTLQNITGDLNILNKANDRDINLQTDNGSGGVATYIKLDGSTTDAYFLNPGNVGIGTASPIDKLHLEGGNARIRTTGNTDVELILNPYSNALGTLFQWEFVGTGSGGNYNFEFRKAGTTYITVDSGVSGTAGNVGIGTTSPGAKLEVRKGGTTAAQGDTDLIVQDSTAGGSTSQVQILGGATGFSNLYFSDTSAYNVGGFIYNHSSNYLATNVNASEKMRITSAGNVGIGTTSPSYKFTAYGSSSDSEIVASFGSANDVFEYTAIGLSGFIAGNDATKAGLALERTASFGVGKLHFLNNTTIDDSDITLSDSRMVIDIDGNIGIGTTSPSSFNSRGRNLVVNSDGDTGITISANSTSSSTLLFADAFGGTGGTATYRGVVEYDHANDSMAFSTAAAYRMRIDSTGNVGIGTTSPATKLHIADVSTPTIRIEDTTNNRNLQLFHDNNNSFIRTSTGSQLTFQTNGGNTRMLIDTSGNVGIGTSSPASKLEVDGGDVEVSDSLNGLILKSPDGTRYRVTVANGGTLTVSAV